MEIDKYIKKAIKIYGDYSNLRRSIPDWRDGLKPVQRRILWSMYLNKFFPDDYWAKSAEVVGDVLGKYHPHGDSSTYESLVSMVHDKYPSVLGYGNFGGILDPPAAMRYTQTKLSSFGTTFLKYLNISIKQKNYTGKYEEPVTIPGVLPLVLLNGCRGIGTGVSTHIPPHNINEILDSLIFTIDHSILKNKQDLIITLIQKEILKGPEYNSGKLLSSKEDLISFYTEGQGKLTFTTQYEFKNNNTLIITSHAPDFNLSKFIKKCKDLKDEGINYVTNSSNSKDIKIIINFDNLTTVKEKILPLLKTSVSYYWYLSDNIKVFSTNLSEYLITWLNWRKEIEVKFLNFEKDKLQKELHLLELKLFVKENAKKIIKLLNSGSLSELKLSKVDQEYILNLKIRTLEQKTKNKLVKKIKKVKKEITIIQNKIDHIWKHLQKTFKQYKKQFNQPRKEKKIIKKELQKKPRYLIVNHNQKVKNYKTIPRNFDFKSCNISKVYSKILVINSSGYAIWKELYKFKKKSFWAVPDNHDVLIACNKQGRGIILDLNNIKSESFQLFKGEVDNIISCKYNDKVWIWSEEKRIYEYKEWKFKRQNSKPFLLIPRIAHPLHFTVIPEKGCIVDNGLNPVTKDNFFNKEFTIIGSKNILYSDSIKVASKKRTLELLKENSEISTQPIY